MRIVPIHDRHDAWLFGPCDEPTAISCRPAIPRCREVEFCCWRANHACAEPDINRVLLKRAFAGLLTRLRSFDWQVIHGHYVGERDGRGTTLDTLA